MPDVAEACLVQLIASYPLQAFRKPKLRLRLHPALLKALATDEPTRQRLNALLNSALTVSEDDESARWDAVKRLLSTLRQYINEPAFQAAIDALLQLNRRPQIDFYPRHDGLVVSATVPVQLEDATKAPVEDA